MHFGTDREGALATVDEIERTGGTALAVRAELGVEDDVETLFAAVEAGLAGRPLTSWSTTRRPRRPARSVPRRGSSSTTSSR
ncbi:hypothetical protein NKG94_13830 [Micromonospora sp. M12]